MITNYRNTKIVIRNGQIAIYNPSKIYETTYIGNSNEIKSFAEKWVDEYFENNDRINKFYNRHGKLVIKGLQQTKDLAENFSKRIFQEAQRYSHQWNQNVYIRFGITGDISLGKSGKPNYQIESMDRKHKEVFQFNGNFFSRINEFEESNITEGFSVPELLELWQLKEV